MQTVNLFPAIDVETKRFASPSTTIFWCKSVDNIIQVEKVEVSSSMFTDWIRKKDHATLAGKKLWRRCIYMTNQSYRLEACLSQGAKTIHI